MDFYCWNDKDGYGFLMVFAGRWMKIMGYWHLIKKKHVAVTIKVTPTILYILKLLEFNSTRNFLQPHIENLWCLILPSSTLATLPEIPKCDLPILRHVRKWWTFGRISGNKNKLYIWCYPRFWIWTSTNPMICFHLKPWAFWSFLVISSKNITSLVFQRKTRPRHGDGIGGFEDPTHLHRGFIDILYYQIYMVYISYIS